MALKYIISYYKRSEVLFATLCRAIIIVCRKKKDIQLLKLEYCTEHIFDNSYIIIRYRFRNAISYTFGNHKTLENNIKIFNFKNFDSDFNLSVYGLFRKQAYKLKIEPTQILNSSSFKTGIQSLFVPLEFKVMPNLKTNALMVNLTSPNINIEKPQLLKSTIIIKNTMFNQNDFI